MKISEVLLEFEIGDALRNVSIADIFGSKLTAGAVADYIPGVDAKDVIKYGSKIKDVIQTNITPKYTIGDALVDAATVIPAVRAAKYAKTGIQGAMALGKGAVKREIGQELIKKNVDIMPDNKSSSSGSSSGSLPSMSAPAVAKKRKYAVGQSLPVKVGNKTHSLKIISVLPKGYEVDSSVVAGAPTRITVPEPLDESATAGATSAGNIATVDAPHLSPGPARGKKSYIGSPGKSGTRSPPQPKPIPQKPGTNGLDTSGSLFGGPAIKR
jgi:hypothetical protein